MKHDWNVMQGFCTTILIFINVLDETRMMFRMLLICVNKDQLHVHLEIIRCSSTIKWITNAQVSILDYLTSK